MADGEGLVSSKSKPVSRAEPQRTLRPINGALSLAGVSQRNGTKEERESGRRAESKCALERFPGRNAVMLCQPDGECAHRQRSRVVATMGDGSASVAGGLSPVAFVESTPYEQDQVAPREQPVGARIVSLQLQRPLQQRHGFGCLFRCRYVDVRNSAQNKVVGVEIVRPFTLDALDFRIAQTWLDCTYHAQRDFVLQRENVVESAVVALRPKMNAGFGLH